MKIKKYLIYSTICSLFLEALYMNVGFDLKFFYLIILLNSLILYRLHSFRLNPWFLRILIAVSLTSLINVLSGNNELSFFLMQFAGIFICAAYYYNFFYYVNNSKLLFHIYLKFSRWVCYIGYPIFFFNVFFLKHSSYRFHSLLAEPAHYGAILMPALYYYSRKFFTEKLYKRELVLLGVSILLSGSSVAFIGVALIILLSNRINFFNLIWAFLIVLIFGFTIYNYDENVKLRVDDSLFALTNFNVDGANLSTYALMSNAYVTQKNIMENPIIGTGLGSYELSHDKYIRGLKGIEYMDAVNEGRLIGLNKNDANSLFLRFVAENGIFGLIIIFVFVFKNRKNVSEDMLIYSNAILCYIILKFFREGHYFSPEMWFFFTFYYLIPKIKKKNEEHTSSSYSYIRE
jgi:hypothetical protein